MTVQFRECNADDPDLEDQRDLDAGQEEQRDNRGSD